MYEWRKLEMPKYPPHTEMVEHGLMSSAHGHVGYKMRAELDYRVVGGRGGVDTGEDFYAGEIAVYGPFGTDENPCLIPSMGRMRYVCCLG